MYGSNGSDQFNLLREKNFNQARQIQTDLVKTEANQTIPTQTPLDGFPSPNGALLLIPFGLMTVCAIITLKCLNTWNLAKNKIDALTHTLQSPCRNCQYFANNPYMKCAVRPDIALTDKAIDCPDYCPKHGCK
ncbi:MULTISPECIES: hypothetical protein [unclassified Anabaena]|uniref:hypothetical protein n=1 Tax=unclassified Anabaena TaxID=2619674 RepID=UPI00082C4FCE|nr:MULTISPECIES: hypothetical protein [unclassified Anabaena]